MKLRRLLKLLVGIGEARPGQVKLSLLINLGLRVLLVVGEDFSGDCLVCDLLVWTLHYIRLIIYQSVRLLNQIASIGYFDQFLRVQNNTA